MCDLEWCANREQVRTIARLWTCIRRAASHQCVHTAEGMATRLFGLMPVCQGWGVPSCGHPGNVKWWPAIARCDVDTHACATHELATKEADAETKVLIWTQKEEMQLSTMRSHIRSEWRAKRIVQGEIHTTLSNIVIPLQLWLSSLKSHTQSRG